MKGVNMQTRWNVNVTEQDIAKAQKNDSYTCVVAQAVARTIPDATRLEVDTQAIRLTRGKERFIYLTPYAVQGYVIAFDAGEAIEPFSFQLRNPRRVKTRLRTAAGKAADIARNAAIEKVRRRKPDATKAEVRAAAKAAYATASEKHKGEPKSEAVKGRLAPPRVFKRKQRAYGHRLLRINKQTEAVDSAS